MNFTHIYLCTYVHTYVRPSTHLKWSEHVGVCRGGFAGEGPPESQRGLAQLVKALQPLGRSLPSSSNELQQKRRGERQRSWQVNRPTSRAYMYKHHTTHNKGKVQKHANYVRMDANGWSTDSL